MALRLWLYLLLRSHLHRVKFYVLSLNSEHTQIPTASWKLTFVSSQPFFWILVCITYWALSNSPTKNSGPQINVPCRVTKTLTNSKRTSGTLLQVKTAAQSIWRCFSLFSSYSWVAFEVTPGPQMNILPQMVYDKKGWVFLLCQKSWRSQVLSSIKKIILYTTNAKGTDIYLGEESSKDVLE